MKRNSWERMSKGYPLPEMKVTYYDDESEYIPKGSYQYEYELRSKKSTARPVLIELLEKPTDEVYYKVLKPSMVPGKGEIVNGY
jgi:hypothetical protein